MQLFEIWSENSSGTSPKLLAEYEAESFDEAVLKFFLESAPDKTSCVYNLFTGHHRYFGCQLFGSKNAAQGL